MKLFAKSNAVILISFATLTIVLAAAAGYFFVQWQKEKARSVNPTELAKKEAKELVAKVGKYMDLPVGEDPTVARVSDANKLASQPFFTKAKNGDQVLIYQQAKLAILYDPKANRILNVAPVNIGTQSAVVAEAAPTFVLYNGTSITGLTKKYETELKSKIPNAVIVDRDNAKSTSVESTILVLLNKEMSLQADKLAQELGISIAPLPDGETAPKAADFLIIVGKDNE